MNRYYLVYITETTTSNELSIDSIDNIGWTTNIYYATQYKSYLEKIVRNYLDSSNHTVVTLEFDNKRLLNDYLIEPSIGLKELCYGDDINDVISDLQLYLEASRTNPKKGTLCTARFKQSCWELMDSNSSYIIYTLNTFLKTLQSIPKKYFQDDSVYEQLRLLVNRLNVYMELYSIRENFCDDQYGAGCDEYDTVRDTFLKSTGIDIDNYERDEIFFGVFSEIDYLEAFTDFEFIWED